VGLLRLRRRSGRDRQRAQRGQRGAHGGGPLPRAFRRGDAGCELLLDGARAAAPTPAAALAVVRASSDLKTAQYVDISCATTATSFDDSSEINLVVYR
jgi:hypothetical protein